MKRTFFTLSFTLLLMLLLSACRSSVEVYNYGTDISPETVQSVKTRVPHQYVFTDYDSPVPNWDSPRGDTTD